MDGWRPSLNAAIYIVSVMYHTLVE